MVEEIFQRVMEISDIIFMTTRFKKWMEIPLPVDASRDLTDIGVSAASIWKRGPRQSSHYLR